MANVDLFTQDTLTEQARSQSLASQTPVPHDDNGRKPKGIERSCVLCHRRKIRCDKRSPCSACSRTGVLCCYPGPEQPTRRPHKTTIADVAARLARLERTIVAISNDSHNSPTNDPNDQSTTSPIPAVGSVAADEAKSAHSSNEEVLVQHGYSSRYFNEVLLSRVLEEEEEIQSVMAMSSSDSDQNGSVSTFNLGGVLSSLNPPRMGSQELHPSKWQAMQLWQAFVNNVDPLTKILHVPTAQIIVFSAINNPNEAVEDTNALLFAIYFAATTSLASKDVENLLGQGKSTALSNFKQGLEASLARANLLETPSLRSLQALVVYLLSVRAYNAGRSIWILNGLAIRPAQSIGMHRDGRHLKISPFDSEMRRRLWWHLNSKDVRAAEDHGITISNFDPSSDISYPLNVDDSELYPTMKELPVVQSKWSETTFSLISIKTNYALQRLYQMASPFNTLPSESTRKETVDNLRAHIEGYLKHCNPDIPIQRASILFARLVIRKLDFVSRQQWLNRSNPERQESHATEENIVDACEILDLNLQIRTDDLLKSFRWSFETYPPYHLLLYLLWHLCVEPVGPSVERAWTVVEGTFAQEEANQRVVTCGPGSKWAVLKMLKEKASRIRNSVNFGELAGNAAGGDTLNADYHNGGFTEVVTDDAFEDDMNWGTDASGFPDWNSLVDDFHLQRYEF